jgi:hypothetical protein
VVARVGESRSALWLDFGPVAVRIPRADRDAFGGQRLEAAAGHRLRVRGWFYRVGEEWRVNVRHPAMLVWPEGGP